MTKAYLNLPRTVRMFDNNVTPHKRVTARLVEHFYLTKVFDILCLKVESA